MRALAACRKAAIFRRFTAGDAYRLRGRHTRGRLHFAALRVDLSATATPRAPGHAIGLPAAAAYRAMLRSRLRTRRAIKPTPG